MDENIVSSSDENKGSETSNRAKGLLTESENHSIQHEKSNDFKTKDIAMEKSRKTKNKEGTFVDANSIRVLNVIEKLNGNKIEIEKLIFQSKNDKDDIKTPIGPWPVSESKTFEYEKGVITNYAKELIQKRVLLLYCCDHEICGEAIELIVKEVVSQQKLKRLNRKLLDFDDTKTERKKVHSLNLRTVIHGLEYNDEPSFIKIDLTSIDFLESLFFTTKENCDSRIKELEQNKVFIICSICDSGIVEKIENMLNIRKESDIDAPNNKLFFPYFEISFLPILLRYHFNTNWQKYYEQIIRQQTKKLWSSKNQEFYKEIDNLLKQGAEEFAYELECREKLDFKESIDEKINELPFSSELHKSLLYIAAFFPVISIYDFRRLVGVVLDDKEISVLSGEDNLQQEVKESDQIHNSKPVIPKKIKLYDLWIKEGDKYLQECNILVQQHESGKMVFDFPNTYMRENIKAHFRKNFPLFLLDQFIYVLNADYFFQLDASESLINNLLKYIVQIVGYDPNYYGVNLLFQVFIKIFNPELTIQLDKSYEELDEKEKDQISKYIIIKNFEHQEGFVRSIELMKLMLDDSEILAEQVNTFMGILLDSGSDIILLEILKNIWRSPRVNELKWIQRVLNQDDLSDDGYEKCLSMLHWLARQSEDRIYDFLKEVKVWSDGGRLKEDDYLNSQLQSILFIFIIGDPLFTHFPLRYYGEWPSKFALFVPFTDEKSITENWKFLIAWLFSDKLKKAYLIVNASQRLPDDAIIQELTHIQTFIIESWWLIIAGIDNRLHEKLQTFALEKLFEILTETVTYDEIKRLGKHWRMWANDYRETIIKLKETKKDDPIILNLYKVKRYTVKMLNDRIQTITNN